MAEQLYWVRKRGEISGPFSVAQLQSLHARGQFARFSEVSVDKITWKQATSVRGLFPAVVPRNEPRNEFATAGEAPAPSPTWSEPPPDSGQSYPRTELGPVSAPQADNPVKQTVCEQILDTNPEWFYLDHTDAQQGPVSLFDLQRLLDVGQVDSTTYACKPGMSEWLALEMLPGLNIPRKGAKGGASGMASGGILLLLAVIGVPMVGLGLVGLLGYQAVDGFRHNNDGEGVLYAFLGLIVFLVVGIAAALLAVIYWRRVVQARKTSLGG